MKKVQSFLIMLLVSILTVTCKQEQKTTEATAETDANGYAVLTPEQIEDLVRRSYQYVAMYNVNNKFALKSGGWNTIDADTKLKDHTMRDIARPNNDSFYAAALLDLQVDPVIMYPVSYTHLTLPTN